MTKLQWIDPPPCFQKLSGESQTVGQTVYAVVVGLLVVVFIGLQVSGYMYAWLDGWMVGWLHDWMVGWLDGVIDNLIDTESSRLWLP